MSLATSPPLPGARTSASLPDAGAPETRPILHLIGNRSHT